MLYNGIMKTLARVLLTVLFILLTPLFVFSLSLKFSEISASSLKTQLAEAKIYKKVVDDMAKASDQPIQGLSPSFLQKKAEKLIDDTDLWLKGKIKESPVISLVDLDKNTLLQLETLGRELKKEQEKARQMGQESDMGNFDFDKFVKNGFAYPIGEQMGFLKNLYFLATSGSLVLGLAMILSLSGIFLLSETISPKLRGLGFAFLGAAFWILPGWLVTLFGFKFLTQALAENAKEIPTFIFPLIDVTAKPVISSYVQIGGVVMVVFFVASIALLISSRSYSSSGG